MDIDYSEIRQGVFNVCKVCNKPIEVGERVIHCEEGVVELDEFNDDEEEVAANNGLPLLCILSPKDTDGTQFTVHASCIKGV